MNSLVIFNHMLIFLKKFLKMGLLKYMNIFIKNVFHLL